MSKKNFSRSRKPVFRSKKSKKQVLGVKSQKNIDMRGLFKYRRKKKRATKKRSAKKFEGK